MQTNSHCQKHVSPVPLVTRDPSAIKTRSDQLTHALTLGLLNADQYTTYSDRRIAVYTQSFAKGKGQISLMLAPKSGEAWNHVLTSLRTLGDELVDTFLALLAIAIDIHGAEYITRPLTLHPDDLLAICQKKKSHGSYTAEQRATVMEHLHTLSRIQVSATLTLRSGKQIRVESTILDSSEATDEQRSQAGCWHSQHVQLGNWSTMLRRWRRQIAVLARRVLSYHAKKQKYEKRLGCYLTLLFRINARKHGGRVKISMRVLLEQSGIIPDLKNPGRTRNVIEKALRKLYTDGVIGPFALIVDNSPRGREVQERIEQRAYHWWDDYSKQRWIFDAPDYIREAYENILRETDIPG